MRSWMIAASLGIITCGFVPALPGAWLIAVLLVASMVLQYFPRLRVAGAFLAGSCWFLVWAKLSLAALWPETPRQQYLQVKGQVWGLPERTARGLRFHFRLSATCQQMNVSQCPAWDNTRAGKTVQLSVNEVLDLEPGQHWHFLVRLQRPHSHANPATFSYETWLIQHAIVATGYVRPSPVNANLGLPHSRPWFNRLRFWLSGLLHEADDSRWRHAALIHALVLGDKSRISDYAWQLYARFGLNHLVVISGLHIGLVAGVMYRVGLLIAGLFPGVLLYFTAPRFAAVLALMAAFIYAGLAGFSLPAFRALIMTAACLGCVLLLRQGTAKNAFCLALLLVLLFDPMAPQSAGFWLSFVAVAILLSQVHESASNNATKAWQVAKIQLLLCIGMFPMMLWFFQQGSLAAPLVNLLAIPWIGMLVVPVALLGLLLLVLVPPLGRLLLHACDYLLHDFMQALHWLQGLPLDPLLILPAPPLPWFLLMIATTWLLLVTRKTVVRLSCCLALPLILMQSRSRLGEDELQLIILDVGQGLAVLVSTRDQHLLYDTGPRYSETFNAGDAILLPYLRHRGIKNLDRVLISHAHDDHTGGLPAIQHTFPMARFMGPDIAIFDQDLQVENCRGQGWESNGFGFRMIHPDEGEYSTNNSSCVLLIDAGSTRIMLPGDIERPVELSFSERQLDLQADILVAPHHGSQSSSSWPFIKRVQPRHVVYSAGFHNRFGHPLPSVQARYETLNADTYNTARSGALVFTIDRRQGITSITEHRRLYPRFWYQLDPP
jgi:competence protein ComEC